MCLQAGLPYSCLNSGAATFPTRITIKRHFAQDFRTGCGRCDYLASGEVINLNEPETTSREHYHDEKIPVSAVCSGDKHFFIKLPSHALCATCCSSKIEKCKNLKCICIFFFLLRFQFLSAPGFSLNFSMDHSPDYLPSTQMSVRYHTFFVKIGI